MIPFLLLACAVEEPPPAQHRVRLETVVLEVDERLQLRAAQATVQDDGSVEAEAVEATLSGEALPGEAEPPPLEIDAPRSEWDMRSRTIRFTGGVRAVRGEVQMDCAELVVTMLDADRVDRAVATGGVTVRRGARLATGAEGVLDARSGEVRLTGAPVLSEGPNRMSGQTITLYLDEERVVCDGCRLVVEGDAVLGDGPPGDADR